MTETEKPSAEDAPQHRFQVGAWLVEPDQGQLTRGGESVRVEPKAMDVLVYLARRQGEVVTREELERDVWHGAIVGYDAVTNTVIKLRKALDDDARRPRYIATIPKKGYRLLPLVVHKTEQSHPGNSTIGVSVAPTATHRSFWLLGIAIVVLMSIVFAFAVSYNSAPKRILADIEPRSADIPTLVVLPFANLGGKGEQQYFIDGMTEDVITNLSRISGLRVIARNSAYAFAGIEVDPREVAIQLGVRYILHGSVRSSGETLRVTTKLIDSDTGAHLWGEQFEGELNELFPLQDLVAKQTAEALSVRLTEEEMTELTQRPTHDFGAYDDYLRGRIAYRGSTKNENELARSMYRRAIEKDPNFALAYAGLALSYIDDFRSGWELDKQEAASNALEMATKSVALDDKLPQAHFAAGFVYLYALSEHEQAMTAARRALELDPNYADAYALLSSANFFAGNLEKTLELDREAMRLNPASSFNYYVHLGRTQYLKDNFGEALDAFLVAEAKDF